MNCQQICKISAKRLNRSENIQISFSGATFLKHPLDPTDDDTRLTIRLQCSCTISSYLTLNNIVTLKFRLSVTQDYWKWHYSTDRIRVPIRLPL